MPDTALHDAFALELAPRSASRGFVRRLLDSTLTPEERVHLARVEQIVALEEDGKKGPAIALELGLEVPSYRDYVRTERYRILRRFIRERATRDDQFGEHERRKKTRSRWDGFDEDALGYYRFAFRKHPKGTKRQVGAKKNGDPILVDVSGDFVEPDRAERAADKVAKGQGWLEPKAAPPKAAELDAGLIQATLTAIAAADRKEVVVRVSTTTTVEVGARDEGPSLEAPV